MLVFEKTCRTCMKSNVPLVDLFGPLKIEDNCSLNLAEVLKLTTNLKVSKEDGLPQNLCNECARFLQNVYTFRRQAHNSEIDLKKVIFVSQIKEEVEYNLKNELDYSNTYDYCLEDDSHEQHAGLPTYICDVCKKQFHKHKKFLNHLASHESHKFICPTCNKGFHKQSSLNRHISKHNEAPDSENEKELFDNNVDEKRVEVKREDFNEQYKCTECSLMFETRAHLYDHIKEHSNTSSNNSFVCNICNKQFSLESTLKLHIQEHTEPLGSTKCLKCSVIFPSYEQLIEHINNCHIDNVKEVKLENGHEQYECLECNLVFTKQRSFFAHLRSHEQGKVKRDNLFKCDNCDKVFSLKTLLRRHMKLHLEDRPFKCSKCTKSYSRQDQLAAHSRKHDGTKPYVCPHCNKAFSQLCSLKDHVRTHTGETPFLCSQCGKGFSNSSNLRQHLRRHTGVKPFACNLCPKTFGTKGQMKQHIDTHTGVHPYKCGVCGAAFTKPNSLKKHKLIHLGIKPFACDTCNMRFTCKDHLTRHKRIHTGERPYRCPHCTRAFAQSNDLNKHVRAHLGQNIYQCTVCQAKFRLMRELKSHYPVHYLNGQPPEAQNELILKCKEDQDNIEKHPDGQITITFNSNVLDKNSLGDITINITPDKISN